MFPCLNTFQEDLHFPQSHQAKKQPAFFYWVKGDVFENVLLSLLVRCTAWFDPVCKWTRLEFRFFFSFGIFYFLVDKSVGHHVWPKLGRFLVVVLFFTCCRQWELSRNRTILWWVFTFCSVFERKMVLQRFRIRCLGHVYRLIGVLKISKSFKTESILFKSTTRLLNWIKLH